MSHQLAAAKAPDITALQGQLAELLARAVTDATARQALDAVSKILEKYEPAKADPQEALARRMLTASELHAVNSTPGATAVNFLAARKALGTPRGSR